MPPPPSAGTWPAPGQAALAGARGARTLEHEWVERYDLPVTFAAQLAVPTADVLARFEAKRLDPSGQMALVAAREAWADAGTPEVDRERLGVVDRLRHRRGLDAARRLRHPARAGARAGFSR